MKFELRDKVQNLADSLIQAHIHGCSVVHMDLTLVNLDFKLRTANSPKSEKTWKTVGVFLLLFFMFFYREM